MKKRKKEFILKDNVGFGEWDNRILKEWDKELILSAGFDDWELIDIFGENDMENKFAKALEGSNFKADEINVNDYIKQNIIFLNEVMFEFEDDEVKNAIKNIKDISTKENFIEDIRKIILRYGKDTL